MMPTEIPEMGTEASHPTVLGAKRKRAPEI